MFFSTYTCMDGDPTGLPGFGSIPRKSNKPPDTKFYDALELSRTATDSEIKRAYHKLAIKHHPDKGGNPEKFKILGRAYEVLSDPEKRKVYDEYGEDGLERLEGGVGGADPTEIFDLVFGRSSRRSSTGENITSPLKVTLEQVYNGAVRKMAITRSVLCSECKGFGGPEDAFETCSSCDGNGIKIQVASIFQQIQTTCPTCRGEGKIMPSKKKCKKCTGVGTSKQKKILVVNVDKGIPNHHKIVMPGEADEKPNQVTGDVVFVADIQDHSVFKRRKNDLYITKSITLSEALFGFKFIIKHLDNRELIVSNDEGKIIKPDDVKIIRGEGMPIYKTPYMRGNLFIIFTVEFPTTLSLNTSIKEALCSALPKPAPFVKPKDEVKQEYYTCEDVDPNEVTSDSKDKDDDRYEGRRPAGIQCSQQ